MTSTNVNSLLFREEMKALKNLALFLDEELQEKDKGLFIFLAMVIIILQDYLLRKTFDILLKLKLLLQLKI